MANPTLHTPIRWTLHRAAGETGFARQTVRNRLVTAGISPGDDDCYSTQEILRALYGDSDGEKLRKLRAEADLAEMERDERSRSLISSEVVEEVWTEVLTNMRGAVQSLDLDRKQKHQILETLRAIKLSDYKQTTAAQSSDDDSAESD